MATVSDDLLKEGKDILSSNDAEEIQKFGDRIISVEPDNWYGLYIRGCGYSLENDFANAVQNWKRAIDGIEDENVAESLRVPICSYLAGCIVRQDGATRLEFSMVSELLNSFNDKLPETDDEVVVNVVLDGILQQVKDGKASNPLITYYATKALVASSFRSYVQLSFFIGFFQKMDEISDALKVGMDKKSADCIDSNKIFTDELSGAIKGALEAHTEEEVSLYEDYWLEHKLDPYLTHILQAYQMSNGVASGKKFLSKMAGKVMDASIQMFIKVYFSAKIEAKQ